MIQLLNVPNPGRGQVTQLALPSPFLQQDSQQWDKPFKCLRVPASSVHEAGFIHEYPSVAVFVCLCIKWLDDLGV